MLIVEVSDTTYHRDRGKKWDANARSGIPVYWIVNVKGAGSRSTPIRLRKDTGPARYLAGQSIPVVIGGREVGRIAVADILPPLRPRAEAGGNGA